MSKSNGRTRNSRSYSSSFRSKLENAVIDYVDSNVYSFTKEQQDYMMQHLEPVDILYRVVDSGRGKESTVDVGETIEYDKMRSFSKGTEGLRQTLNLMEELGGIESKTIIRIEQGNGFSLRGIVEKNSDRFGSLGASYASQDEYLVGGKYEVVKKGTGGVRIRGVRYVLPLITVRPK